MAVTSTRERALQVVLVVLGLLTIVANIYPLVTSLLTLRPTGGTTAPMFYTIFAHTAVMALMAIQLPSKRGELLAGVAVTGLGAVLLFVFAPRKETASATS